MCRLVFVIALAALVSASPAQERKKGKDKDAGPKVRYAVPLVVELGKKQKLALRGKNLDAVTEVKVSGADGAAAKVLAARKVPVPNNFPGERVGDSEVEIELDLPAAAKPGAVKLTAVGPAGESEYTPLVAGDLPVVKEKEPNDGFDQAQPVPVPCAVDATIKAERDPDVFRFDGKKGEKLRVEVAAARFGSPVDALLVVYDADRRVLDSSDDAGGSSDPSLVVTLPRDGAYFVSVIDAHDLGGANFGYRLVVKKDD
jgi:hypothetical protein